MSTLPEHTRRWEHRPQPTQAFIDSMAAMPGRCAHGFHIETQHPDLCACQDPVAPADEWTVFKAALRQAADPTGLVSQTRVRPLIQAIPHKHRGLLYRRARQEGLLEPAGAEESTDYAGGNGDKVQRVYRLRGAA